MRVLTWLPGDLHDELRRLDPARDTAAAPDRLRALMDVRSEAVVDRSPPGRPGGRRVLAVCLAVVVVVLAAVGALLFRPSGGAPRPAVRSSTGIGPRTSVAADLWAGFPVGARPRPVVPVGPTVDVPKLVDDAGAVHEVDPRFSVHASLPTSRSTRDGYRLITAASAVDLLRRAVSGQTRVGSPVSVSGAHLGTHQFATDRGYRTLPAWRLSFAGFVTDAYVLAVDPSARFNPTPDGSGGLVTVSADGRRVTIGFVAHHVGGICDSSYDSTLAVAQTPTAVVLAVTTTYRRPVPMPSNVTCMLPAHMVPKPSPGAPDTVTVTLGQPVGARAVVDAHGAPYVTSG